MKIIHSKKYHNNHILSLKYTPYLHNSNACDNKTDRLNKQIYPNAFSIIQWMPEVPQSHALSLVSGPRSFPGGTPVPDGGTLAGTGVPPGWGWGTPLQLGLKYPPPPGDSTEERVLATQRAVRLLSSCRRTFFLAFIHFLVMQWTL